MVTSASSEALSEGRHESWNESMSRSQFKHHGQLAPLPTQLPAKAHLPSCAGKHNCAQNCCI